MNLIILDILFKIDDPKLKDIAVFLTKYENNTHFIQFIIPNNLICLKLLFISFFVCLFTFSCKQLFFLYFIIIFAIAQSKNRNSISIDHIHFHTNQKFSDFTIYSSSSLK